MEHLTVRPARPGDLADVAAMCHCLWPDANATEQGKEMAPLLDGHPPGALPTVVLLAVDADGRAVGFPQAGLRSYADGYDPSRLVGYIEGWYVESASRRQGVGERLVAARRRSGHRSQGCLEMASDTWL